MMHPKVKEAIEALEDEHGRVTPRAVVDAARDPDSPLHDHFTWDDGKAADNWRIREARELIVQVRLEVTRTEMTYSTPAYIRDPDMPADEQGYRAVLRVASEEDTAHAAMVMEMARVASHLRRARELAAVLGQVEAVARIEREVESFRKSLERSEEQPRAS